MTGVCLLAVALLAYNGSCATVPRTADGTSVRVMSYNIRSGNGNLGAVADAIRAAAADIVALQEVDVHWAERSSFADQASALGARLGMSVRFARIYRLMPTNDSLPPREFGVAVLTHYPIVRWANDSLTRLSTQDTNPTPRRMPGLLDVTIDLHGTPVRVLNTHLDYRADPAVRAAQVAEMLNYLDAAGGPTIVCGDMNATPGAPELRPLLGRLRDAWRDPNEPGFTYPADQPGKRIDYVLVTGDFQIRSTRVLSTLASDHRPVVADLVLEPRSPNATR